MKGKKEKKKKKRKRKEEIWWLKTIEIHSPAVLKARSLNQSVSKTMLPPKSLGEISFFALPLPACGVSKSSLACVRIISIPTCGLPLPPPLLSNFPCVSLIK